MRVCRFKYRDQVQVGLYDERQLVPLAAGAEAFAAATHERLSLPAGDDLLDFLPNGKAFEPAKRLADWVARSADKLPASAVIPTAAAELLVPIPRPNKLLLLAGNYGKHIEEGGGRAPERETTFPYVFMKPPSTTLTHPGRPIRIPAISPGAIDWELELAVVIGRRVKGIKEADALSAVAGFTIINDISNRKFRPNPGRQTRDKDTFFDWQHGKWHDSFCPCGPCIASADAIANPQQLAMKLTVNGEIKQDGNTRQQIFPVAAVIEFIASFVTLEPGDIISTGTPSGVGAASGTFLKPGDRIEGSIAQIGVLSTTVEAE